MKEDGQVQTTTQKDHVKVNEFYEKLMTYRKIFYKNRVTTMRDKGLYHKSMTSRNMLQKKSRNSYKFY